jgi:fructose-bisphosphate aldolase class I
VLVVDPATGAPTPLALHEAAHGLARYAAICQEAGLVPVMEPELLADGAHSVEACAAATEAALHALFAACAEHGVRLEGALLKPNMVTPGDAAPGGRPPPAEVAAATLRVLRRCVPPALPGVLFLSGGQPERVATANLDAMARAPGAKPWALTFSYGRALQASALKGRYSGTVTEFGEAPSDAWNAAIEAAVKACEAELTSDTTTCCNQTYNQAARDCAAAVRRLKR